MSVARWDSHSATAGGRIMHYASTAAVEKSRKSARSPEDFSGTARRHGVITRRSVVQIRLLHPEKTVNFVVVEMDLPTYARARGLIRLKFRLLINNEYKAKNKNFLKSLKNVVIQLMGDK